MGREAVSCPEHVASMPIQQRLDFIFKPPDPDRASTSPSPHHPERRALRLVSRLVPPAIKKAREVSSLTGLSPPHMMAWIYWCILTPALGGLVVG